MGDFQWHIPKVPGFGVGRENHPFHSRLGDGPAQVYADDGPMDITTVSGVNRFLPKDTFSYTPGRVLPGVRNHAEGNTWHHWNGGGHTDGKGPLDYQGLWGDVARPGFPGDVPNAAQNPQSMYTLPAYNVTEDTPFSDASAFTNSHLPLNMRPDKRYGDDHQFANGMVVGQMATEMQVDTRDFIGELIDDMVNITDAQRNIHAGTAATMRYDEIGRWNDESDNDVPRTMAQPNKSVKRGLAPELNDPVSDIGDASTSADEGQHGHDSERLALLNSELADLQQIVESMENVPENRDRISYYTSLLKNVRDASASGNVQVFETTIINAGNGIQDYETNVAPRLTRQRAKDNEFAKKVEQIMEAPHRIEKVTRNAVNTYLRELKDMDADLKNIKKSSKLKQYDTFAIGRASILVEGAITDFETLSKTNPEQKKNTKPLVHESMYESFQVILNNYAKAKATYKLATQTL